MVKRSRPSKRSTTRTTSPVTPPVMPPQLLEAMLPGPVNTGPTAPWDGSALEPANIIYPDAIPTTGPYAGFLYIDNAAVAKYGRIFTKFHHDGPIHCGASYEVTISNFRITGDLDFPNNRQYPIGINVNEDAGMGPFLAPATIINGEIRGFAENGVKGSDFTISNCNIHSMGKNGIYVVNSITSPSVSTPVTINNNWIHHLGWNAPGRALNSPKDFAAIIVKKGHDISIINNYLDIPSPNAEAVLGEASGPGFPPWGQGDAIALLSVPYAAVPRISATIDSNWINAGNSFFSIEGWSVQSFPTVTISNNKLLRGYGGPKPWYFNNGTPTFDNNIWLNDSAEISGVFAFDEHVPSPGWTATPIITSDPNLLGHWPFEEGTGTITENLGLGAAGTLVNAAWSSEGSPSETANNSLEFNGVNSRVDLGSIDVVGDKLTIALWAKASSFSNLQFGDPRLLSKASNGVGEQDHFWMISGLGSSTAASLRFRLKAGGVTTTLGSPPIPAASIPLNEWVHAAVVYDGATMSIYKNGIQVASTPKTGIIDVNPAALVSVGDQPVGAGEGTRPFDGLIDEVYIYDKVLTEAEILLLAEVPPPEPSPTVDVEFTTQTGSTEEPFTGSTPVQLAVTMTETRPFDVRIPYTLAGYGANPADVGFDVASTNPLPAVGELGTNVIIIPTGETTGTVNFSIFADAEVETPEQFSITLEQSTQFPEVQLGTAIEYIHTINPIPPPQVPTNVAAFGGDGQVSLSWSTIIQSTFLHFNVYRSEIQGGPYTLLGSSQTTNYLDDSVVNDTTYYYVITSVTQ